MNFLIKQGYTIGVLPIFLFLSCVCLAYDPTDQSVKSSIQVNLGKLRDEYYAAHAEFNKTLSRINEAYSNIIKTAADLEKVSATRLNYTPVSSANLKKTEFDSRHPMSYNQAIVYVTEAEQAKFSAAQQYAGLKQKKVSVDQVQPPIEQAYIEHQKALEQLNTAYSEMEAAYENVGNTLKNLQQAFSNLRKKRGK